jgi:hypothetical protein
MDNTEECMVCFEKMGSTQKDCWNVHRLPCSHKICVDCATKLQSMSDESDYTISSDETDETNSDEEYEEIEYDGMRFQIHMVPRQLEPDFQQDQAQEIKPYPVDYTVKYSKEGCTFTRVNYFILEGRQNPMQCPYCRQRGPNIYDFGEIRYCVPSLTTEWNILERKFYNDRVSSHTMSKEGKTFAFKLSKDESCLRLMWTEVNTYPFTLPKHPPHTYSDFKKMPKKQKDSRTYSRTKRYSKMIR